MKNRNRYKIAVSSASSGFLTHRDLKAIARYQFQNSSEIGYTIYDGCVALNNPLINMIVLNQSRYN